MGQSCGSLILPARSAQKPFRSHFSMLIMYGKRMLWNGGRNPYRLQKTVIFNSPSIHMRFSPCESQGVNETRRVALERSTRWLSSSVTRAVDQDRNLHRRSMRLVFCFAAELPAEAPDHRPVLPTSFPLPRLVLPTASLPFWAERNCRPGRVSSHFSNPSASKAPSRARHASSQTPSSSLFQSSSRSPTRETRRVETAMPLRFAESTESLESLQNIGFCRFFMTEAQLFHRLKRKYLI